MVKLRPCTAADIELLYGALLPITVYGITAVDENDHVLGMGAVYPVDGCMAMICNIDPEARKRLKRHTRVLLKGARRLQAIAARRHLPVRAVALLLHLGFCHIEKDVYEWTTPA